MTAPPEIDCLDYCARAGARAVILALPEAGAAADLAALVAHPLVRGLVLPAGLDTAALPPDRVGHFQPELYSWALPPVSCDTLAYLGPRWHIGYRMARGILRRRIRWLVYHAYGGWHRQSTLEFLMQYASVRLRSHAERVSRRSGLPFAGVWGGSDRLVRRLHRLFDLAASWRGPHAAHVPGRVLHFNASLAWGGAERQLVNTVLGLRARGHDDVHVICEHLHDRLDHDFYLARLAARGIAVTQLGTLTRLDPGGWARQELLERVAARLPWILADEVCAYLVEILNRRPEVVHAWQDTPSIKAGIAAVIAGVPRIVLGARNMAPFRFAYFMPYMRAAYRALAECPRVTLLNNSRPGAEDYARWLDLPSARIGVLRNGFIASGPAPAEHEVTHYRAVLGIPAGAPLIGAVFRFYEEKDPLLWVRTAAAVIRALPEARFLLVGTGPLADMIRRAAGDLGIADRLVTPGTEQNVRLALASMDVLLLTSKLEGTPNVVLEAQACGVPVVATEAGGTRDAIAGGVTGWCETARDADRLASRIVRALTDHAWRAQARTAGPAFVAERFDIDRMLDETLRSYGWPARQIS